MTTSQLHENLLRRATIGDLVTRSAERFRDKVVFISGNERVTFHTLNEKSCIAANAFLDMGIKKGDRVAFMSHNCLNYVYCRLGLAKIGAVPVPINFMLKGDEIAYIINDAEPIAFMVEDALAETVQKVSDKLTSVKKYGWFDFGKSLKPEEWVDVGQFFTGRYAATEPEMIIDSDDMATLIYTTGTESIPKGVMTSHFNYYMSLLHLATDCDFRREDVLIIDIPLFHVAGTTILLATIAFGTTALIEYAPNPVNTLQKTQEEKVTYWIYPPTLYHAIPHMPGFEKFDVSSLKKCISFGAIMPPVVLEKWNSIKSDIQWRNYWGQTESTPVGTTSIPEQFSSKIHSIGIPDTGVTVKVFNDNDCEVPVGQVGELVIRGPAVMKGYWKMEEKTSETLRNGWLHTGDLGYIDSDGYIYFVDRKKDMIKSGGENVASQEVEGVILKHPKVASVAVIGLPHEYWIEAVSAFVVPRPGIELTEDEIIEFCKQNMAGFKVPKNIFIKDSLPMSPTGKILKRIIKEEHLKAM